MRTLEEITDINELREVARAALGSTRLLEQKVARLTAQLNALGKDHPKLAEVKRLLEDLEREKHRPGHKGESRKAPAQKKPRRPRRGHGPTPQDKLREEEVTHVLDDADRACPDCGKHMPEMAGQFEESEVIDVHVREHVRKVHKRQKYRCACGHIETALGEPRLSKGGRYSDAFIASVVVQKYDDHLPLERQAKILAREGLRVTTQVLWDQAVVLFHKVMKPALIRLRAHVACKRVRHADETRWPVLGAEAKNWAMWVEAADDAVFYDILETRSAEDGRPLLEGKSGILLVDGAALYAKLAREYPDVKLAHCWAHARRKFRELEESEPVAKRLLDLIGQLFHVDKDGPPEERLARRQARSRPIINDIRSVILESTSLPGTPLRRGMEYVMARWTGLTRFLEDADIPLDNNLAERSLRGPVVGRKNHYGSKSRLGTEVAAAAYSLVETARLNGVAPDAYFRAAIAAFHAGVEIPLPHELKAG